MGKYLLLVMAFILHQYICSAEVIKNDGHGSNKSEKFVVMSDSVKGITFTVQSPVIIVFMDIPSELSLNYSIDCTNAYDDYGIIFSVTVEHVVSVSSRQPVFIRNVTSRCRQLGSASGDINVTLTGILLGRTLLKIDVHPGLSPEDLGKMHSAGSDTEIREKEHSYLPSPETETTDGDDLARLAGNGSDQFPAKFMIVCMKKPTTLDNVVQYLMMIILVITMFAMGCKTEFGVLKKVWRRPVAPAIGLFCQFVLMPMIAYVLTLVIPFPTPSMALGFFACGCAPGGGGSNLWSYLLGGDVSLSAAMTTISNVAAVGTFPMWIFTLGQVVLSEQSDVKIPYLNMIISLLMVAIPLTIGAILNHTKQELTRKLMRFFIPVVVVLTIVFLIVALYANFYMFRLVKPILFLSGAILPYIGYIFGLVLALLFRQSWKFSKTIAIETGIQNSSIAFILVMFSFPPPDNVIAATPAIASKSVTPFPLILIAVIYHIYLRCCKKKPEPESDDGKFEKTKNGLKENGTVKEKEAMVEEKVSSV